MSPSASSASPIYDELKNHLKEMFQMNRGDLDFGIYRIMNMKRDEVSDFLNNDLLKQVRDILKAYKPADFEETKRELTYAEVNTHKFSPDYINELRQKLSQSIDVDKIETEIYSDLYNFFKRYYSEGDFMSLRRYKEGIYALPYEGEEVKLHWANHDQYYIKTSEDLKHYTFKVDNGKRVRFEIVEADTEKNNNKEAADKTRRFLLAEENYLSEEDGQLTIRFEYRPDNAKRKQDDINKNTVETLLGRTECIAFGLNKASSNKKPAPMVLEKHLTTYTAKYTFDYFIHKDLGGFLRRELDFFIKNEIMHLDDIENETAPKVENYLAKIRAMRQVAHKIITLLAQLEDFQKKLWLKKKFVLDTHYCVTLDHIIGSSAESALLPQIIANAAQRKEWVELFAIDDVEGYSAPLTESFLKVNDKLQVDTRFFDTGFKYVLLSVFDNFDDATNGLLINSENFQALRLLQERYREGVSCVHIDPPYNTKTSGFIYKNSYQHSSWLAMMEGRLELATPLLKDESSFHIHIDENEYERLNMLTKSLNFLNIETLIWDKRNPMNGGQGLANQHEYVLMMSNKNFPINKRTHNIKLILKKAEYLIASSGSANAEIRKKFASWLKANKKFHDYKAYQYIDDQGNVYQSVSLRAPELRSDLKFHEPLIHPKTGKPCPTPPNGFSRTPETLASMIEDELILFGKDEKVQPRQKSFLSLDTQRQMSSVLQNAKKGMNDVAPMKLHFPYCHPVSLYEEIIGTASHKKNESILDYFAGSGTTGHAVINLNREDNGNRKYILVEMGKYFNTVTKHRVQKAAYSKDWKDGKPISREGVKHVIKYITLEQYEDTLDNLQMKKTAGQDDLFDQNPKAHESYILNYMLNVESKSSPSLLNIDGFNDPLKYMLKIIRDGEVNDTTVDLIETFNYLIGLRVQKINQAPNGIISVEGKTPQDEKCLIIWRDINNVDSDALDKWFTDNHLQKNLIAQVIYVNGDNNLENLKPKDQKWEVRLTEEEFKRRMFDGAE